MQSAKLDVIKEQQADHASVSNPENSMGQIYIVNHQKARMGKNTKTSFVDDDYGKSPSLDEALLKAKYSAMILQHHPKGEEFRSD